MVVLPAPLGPTIRVKGLKKVMTCLFSGSKLRIPFISILSTVLIFATSLSTHAPEKRGREEGESRRESTAEKGGTESLRVTEAESELWTGPC